jgi:hypothetical protein
LEISDLFLMELLLAIFALLLAAAALLLAVHGLARGGRVVESQNGIREELTQVAGAQRRLLEQVHNLAHRQKVLAERLGDMSDDSEAQQLEEAMGIDPQAVKEDVLFLARQGLSAEKIARELNIPRGEIELILDLERFGTKS